MSGEKIGPIKPQEVLQKKLENFPSAVFESFNELIAKGFNGNQATVYQETVVDLMIEKGLNKSAIYENHWLDVEDLYKKKGWKVDYDKPGYNESYAPYFVFRYKRQNLDEL